MATTRDVVTFCRICEPCCGLIATVEGERVVEVRPDRDNPHSQGFMCTKAPAMMEVTDDPERVVHPLRRIGGSGEFVRVSWDEALADIAHRLRSLIRDHGPGAVGTFLGNPPAFNASGWMAFEGFRKAIGSPWKYGVGGEDGASAIAANAIQFGSAALMPRPDLWRTHFLLVLGANPFVSRGSLFSEPQVRPAMRSIVDRGGRVVIVDPRRTETARQFEHLPIRAGADAWLLLGMLRTIIDDDLVDHAFVERHAEGFDRLADVAARVDVDRCSTESGVPAGDIVGLARAMAAAPSAVAYGRTGTCTQRFGTLNYLLLNALNTVTGNLGRAGSAMFGWGAIDTVRMAQAAGYDTFGAARTRTLGLPDAFGLLPSQSLWRDITEPGEDRIRALVTYGANPVHSSGAGGQRLATALEELDLHVSLDLYVNETNRHADYVLPATTFFERPDVPLVMVGMMLRPSVFATDRIVAPRGEAREEWRVFNEIARRMGRGGAYPLAPLRWLARLGIEVDPHRIIDLMLRTGPAGDWFGLRRRGVSLKKLLTRHPHGIALRDHLPELALDDVVRTPTRRVSLAPDELVTEASRLRREQGPRHLPLRAIGMREVRSHNTWMHNVSRLVPDSRVPAARVHPHDAAAAGVVDGEPVRIESAAGVIEMAAIVTDEMTPGTVAIPHGWGHAGGWTRANAAGGANSNDLASPELEDIEPIAGMSVLNGIPIRIASGRANSQ